MADADKMAWESGLGCGGVAAIDTGGCDRGLGCGGVADADIMA